MVLTKCIKIIIAIVVFIAVILIVTAVAMNIGNSRNKSHRRRSSRRSKVLLSGQVLGRPQNSVVPVVTANSSGLTQRPVIHNSGSQELVISS